MGLLDTIIDTFPTSILALPRCAEKISTPHSVTFWSRYMESLACGQGYGDTSWMESVKKGQRNSGTGRT